MQHFKRLTAWKQSEEVTVRIWQLTASFPGDAGAVFGEELRIAATTVPEKIANASGREGAAGIARMLQVARGSAVRLDHLLLLARDLNLLEQSEYQRLVAEVEATKNSLTMLIRRFKPTIGKKVIMRPSDRWRAEGDASH